MLAKMEIGERGIIYQINGTEEEKLDLRMKGIVEGRRITVANKIPFQGEERIAVGVSGQIVVLSFREALKVIVEQEDYSCWNGFFRRWTYWRPFGYFRPI